MKTIRITLILLFVTSSLYAQRVDFETFPRLDADYQHLDLTLEFVEGTRVNGELVYSLELLRDDVRELQLDAIRMDIEQVEWEGRTIDFRVDDDRLVVTLPEGVARNRSYRLGIRYRADPAFGVLRSQSGTIWSSGLPASVRHWLPVVDHPRNHFTVDASLIVPVETEVLFSGVAADEAVESVDLKRARFYTDAPVPASSLRFAIGDFEQSRTTVGRHRIELYSEPGLLDEAGRAELLEQAREAFQFAGQLFGISYPSRTLTVVVLEDDRWEVKSYGAGVLFAYHSLGHLQGQVATGVLAQWAGIHLQEESWQQAAPIILLQAWLLNEFEGSGSLSDGISTERSGFDREGLYEPFSDGSRRAWRAWLESEEAALLRQPLADAIPDLLQELPEVVNWYDLASWLYRRSGLPLMEPPAPEWPETDESLEPALYRVIYHYDEQEGRLRLEFIASETGVDELVSVTAEEITFRGRSSRELAFTGSRDEVVLNVDRSIENLLLTVTDDVNVVLEVEKPFTFWLHQLRNEEEPFRRIEAAVRLQDYDDNPDLQLALLDLIEGESDPEVYAGMIRTLSSITDGASGTDQLFRQRFNSDRDPAVQLALVEAFAGYEGNQTVISLLNSTILRSRHPEVRREAVLSLARVTGPERFLALSESLIFEDATVPVVPALLSELVRLGLEEEAISYSATFLESNYPYSVRVEVLDLLIGLDRSARGWQERIDQLSADNDARIRFRILDGLVLLPESQRRELIEERLLEEYDERVRSRLRQMNR